MRSLIFSQNYYHQNYTLKDRDCASHARTDVTAAARNRKRAPAKPPPRSAPVRFRFSRVSVADREAARVVVGTAALRGDRRAIAALPVRSGDGSIVRTIYREADNHRSRQSLRARTARRLVRLISKIRRDRHVFARASRLGNNWKAEIHCLRECRARRPPRIVRF